MSETPVTQVETPVEKIYKYQPVDENNRPIGGMQVIKYTTEQELVQKLQEQNILLIRKLREQTKKVRLGIDEQEDIAPDAPRFDGPVEFAPRELTEDERYDIARRMTDPVTAAQAAQELVEASIGTSLPKLGEAMQSLQRTNIALMAKVEANAFVADNPGYYKCPENFEAISSWMVRYNLAPVKANFQKAYETLKAQGLLIEGPAIVEEVPVIVAPVEEPVVETPVAPVVEEPVVRLPSGLTNDMTSPIGTPVAPGSDIVYVTPDGKKLTGLQAIAAMPGEEYGKRLKADKNFGKAVEKLEAEARKPRG